jgi:hypothetical protein
MAAEEVLAHQVLSSTGGLQLQEDLVVVVCVMPRRARLRVLRVLRGKALLVARSALMISSRVEEVVARVR